MWLIAPGPFERALGAHGYTGQDGFLLSPC
jgi:hypothetical protein